MKFSSGGCKAGTLTRAWAVWNEVGKTQWKTTTQYH